MADRIRLNRRGGASYAGAGALSNCSTADCTTVQIAALDILEWQTQVDRQLPGGVGAVAYAGTTPPTYTISVTWQEVGAGPLTHQIAVRIPDL